MGVHVGDVLLIAGDDVVAVGLQNEPHVEVLPVVCGVDDVRVDPGPRFVLCKCKWNWLSGQIMCVLTTIMVRIL